MSDSETELPEVVLISRDEYNRAVAAALADIGLTYPELLEQGRTGDFSSLRARKLWLTIGEQP